MFNKKEIKQYETTLLGLGYQFIDKQSKYADLSLVEIYKNKVWESGWYGKIKFEVYEMCIGNINHQIICININIGRPIANCKFYIKEI